MDRRPIKDGGGLGINRLDALPCTVAERCRATMVLVGAPEARDPAPRTAALEGRNGSFTLIG